MQVSVISRRLPAAVLLAALAACASDTKRPADAAGAPAPVGDSAATATAGGGVAATTTTPPAAATPTTAATID